MKRATTCLAAAIALATFAPATAGAKPKGGKPKPATFKLEIEGEQLTAWNYIKQQEPSCDFPEYASGTQYIDFDTYVDGEIEPAKVRITPAAHNTVGWKFASDDVSLLASARLRAVRDTLYAQMSPCAPGQGPFGGDDPPVDVHDQPGCDETGQIDLALSTSIEEMEDPSYPSGLLDAKEPKSPLYFAGVPAWFSDASDHNLPAACAENGSPGAEIGIVESQGEWPGGLVVGASSLSAKKLLGSRKKRTKVEFHRVVEYPNETQSYAGPPSTTGRTVMDATFTFTRMGRK